MPHPDKHAAEQSEADERQAPSGRVVYQAILREADEELARPSSALWWSAIAAGLSMSFSMIAEALLQQHLPDAAWRPLVAKLGYSVGFLVVILGRQQLFTENTLTPILPLLLRKDVATSRNVARLWGIVLLGNMAGALVASWIAVHTSAFEPGVRETFVELGRDAMKHSFGTTALRGIYAGWLIALIVWLLPFAESARVWVIVIITYVVGIASFAHIVAGAVETFAAAWTGAAEWRDVFTRFIMPALLGNILGGVTLVAALNHAQIVSGAQKQEA